MLTMILASMIALTPGEPLPVLKGEFLTGKQAILPEAASGRVALLALGFTYNSRFAVEAWIGRFRKDFDNNPQVTFYEVPMIGGMARMAKWFIDSGMRKGTPKKDQSNVITVYGGTDPWKQRVNFDKPESAYLILIDQRGMVHWQFGGGFDEESYRKLASETKALLR
jgi:hypothetical protein